MMRSSTIRPTRTDIGAVGDLAGAIGISVIRDPRTGTVVQLIARDPHAPGRKPIIVELDPEGYRALKALIAKTDEALALPPQR